MPTRKLSKEDLAKFEAILRHLLNELNGDIRSLEIDALGDETNTPVSTKLDDGGDAYSQEFSLELLQRDENAMSEVIEALERIREGSFGRCMTCEKWIRRTRLNAVPYARNCIDCQRAAEADV